MPVPITLAKDTTRRWLVATATGTLTIADILAFLQTARASVDLRMWPLLFDGRGAQTTMKLNDVERAVAVVGAAIRTGGPRAHVAIVADDDRLYRWMLAYETRCTEIDVRTIRVFRQRDDAEHWLEAVSAARHFQ